MSPEPKTKNSHAFVVTEKIYETGKIYPSIRDFDAAVYMKYQGVLISCGLFFYQ